MTDPLRGSDLPPAPLATYPNAPLDGEKRVARDLGPPVTPDGTIASTAPSGQLLDAPAVVGTAAGLAEQAQNLADEVKALRLAADSLAKRARRNEWTTQLTALGLVLDIALSIFAFVLLNNQSASNARLEASIHESCTLYGFIISSYRETARQASPLGPDAYDQFYRAMQTSADHLNCGIPHKI